MAVGGGFREFVARVGGRDRGVRVEPDQEGLRVRIDGEEFHIGCARHADGEIALLVNGRAEVVHVREGRDGRYRVTLHGGEIEVEIADPIAARLAAVSRPILQEGTIEIRSPMHGTVVTVQADEGDQVDEESPLVVLEAMKMQNALTSPAPATVRQVLVSPGQTVEGDTLLIVLDRLRAESTQ